jgi:hypothetical protein
MLLHILIHFFIGFGVDQILYKFGCEYRFFRCRKLYGFGLVMERNQTFLSRIICAYMLFFMMRNNSLTKVIKQQYNTK